MYIVGYVALARGSAALYVLGPMAILYVMLSFDTNILWRCWLIPGSILFLFRKIEAREIGDHSRRLLTTGYYINKCLSNNSKAISMLGFIFAGVIFGAWISHHYFNYLAQHWSQAHLFETYFKEKKGDEPIYAYQLHWRGEIFYGRNTELQLKKPVQIISLVN